MGLKPFTIPPFAIFFGFLALFNAIATACFCGRPSDFNFRMLLLTVAGLEPLRNGILTRRKISAA